jgi:hypothetical protein
VVAARHDRVANEEQQRASRTRGVVRETRDNVSGARECCSRTIHVAAVIGASASERARLSVGIGWLAAGHGGLAARREGVAAGRRKWRVNVVIGRPSPPGHR